MADRVEIMHGCLIQHGHHNDRIYLMKLNPGKIPTIIEHLDEMAARHGYGKILAKIPAPAAGLFRAAGYVREAVIPRWIRGATDGCFMAKFTSRSRRTAAPASDTGQPAPQTGSQSAARRSRAAKPAQSIVACTASDAREMSTVFSANFKTYPFPIQESAYLQQMINAGVQYYCIRKRGSIAALAAAEIDLASQNAELTDFATIPECRGMGLAGILLLHLEQKSREAGVRTTYTIARAASPAMNYVFRNQGYKYAGLLLNNTQICGSIESMSVWYKHL